jgi:hypothetical protein
LEIRVSGGDLEGRAKDLSANELRHDVRRELAGGYSQ